MPHDHRSASARNHPRPASADAGRQIEDTLARLWEIHSMVVVAAAALLHQNCELDADVARVLQRTVATAIAEQIARLRRL